MTSHNENYPTSMTSRTDIDGIVVPFPRPKDQPKDQKPTTRYIAGEHPLWRP